MDPLDSCNGTSLSTSKGEEENLKVGSQVALMGLKDRLQPSDTS